MKKRQSKGQTSFFDEIIVDNFAGGGGASIGMELAAGKPVYVAINHDADAIRMHKTNHPHTIHLQESVWDIKPAEVCAGHPVALAWFSPDCKHFSKAKGGKPVEKHIRGLAWVSVRWAATVKPKIIILENVEEFQTWGPLIAKRDPATGRMLKKVFRPETDDVLYDEVVSEPDERVPHELRILYPDPKQKGRTFRSFINALKYQGYEVDYRVLVAADYGAPTTRKRFFLIARSDGLPIVWPEATHAPAGSADVISGIKKPWRSAAEIIDFTLPCPSIFSSKQEIKDLYNLSAQRPLADKTLRRIIRGVDKFTIRSGSPFVVGVNHGEGGDRGLNINDPINTITGKHGHGVITPNLINYKFENEPENISRPLSTITSVGAHELITPSLMAIGQTGGGDRNRSVEDPVHTQVSKAESCLIAPSLIQYHQEQAEDVRGQAINKTLNTIDTSNRYGLSAASFTEYFGNAQDGLSLDEPLHTVTGKDREGLTLAHISKYYDGGYTGAGSQLQNPLDTVTARDHNSLCMTHVTQFKGQSMAQDASEPLNTITSKEEFGTVAAHIAKFKGDNLGQSMEQPLQTITASASINRACSGGTFGIIAVKVIKAEPGADLQRWPEIRSLLNKYCDYSFAGDDILLLLISDTWYYISDIGLRMLIPRELFAAQGFPADYIIDIDYLGVPFTKAEQVAKCGNSVCPPLAYALTKANLPSACSRQIKTVRELEEEIAV